MSPMHSPIVFALALGALLASPAAAQDAERFAPSGRGTSTLMLTQAEGMAPVSVSVDFGQPHLRGRALHTDSLVPYGAVWRTGANGTTILETGIALRIGGVTLPKGRYALFTLPSASGWKLIVQADIGQSVGDYDAVKDLVRADMRRREMHTAVESLSIALVPATTGLHGELRVAWGTTEVAVDWTAVAAR